MNHHAARQLIQDIRDAWNDIDPERVATFYTEDCESYDVEFDVPARGRDQIAAGVRMYLDAYPDSKFVVENVVVDGNTIVEQWVADGHHNGEIWGIPATGNYTKSRGCTVIEVTDEGLVHRETSYWDSAGMYRQINALIPRAAEPEHLAH